MQKSEELKKIVVEMYNNMFNPSYFENKILKTDDLLSIGTDESEWITGYENFMTSLKKQAEVIPDAKVTNSNPNAYVEGSVAWFNDKVTLAVNNDKVNMRVTGVLHKEGDNWKLVQGHFSIGMPNADTAFGDVRIVD